jgi:hypothetical protein
VAPVGQEGIDDLDKLPSIDPGEAPRCATLSLGAEVYNFAKFYEMKIHYVALFYYRASRLVFRGLLGTTTWYAWPNDRGLSMSVYVSTSPLFGILELIISRKTAVS